MGTPLVHALVSVLAITIMTAPSPAQRRVWYVDADAPGIEDGSSWENAFQNLQDALAAAAEGDEIRVGQGTYTPDSRNGDRAATFEIVTPVVLLGGYAGFGEPDPDHRDISAYATILSGDLNGDDGPEFQNNDENSYHVVTVGGAIESAILEGFVITRGNANSRVGGGILNENGRVTLRRCTIERNTAWRGGGMYNDMGAAPSLVNCRLRGNVAQGEGGAMYSFAAGVRLESCALTDNRAGSDGGALFSDLSGVSLIGCTLVENESQSRGGGLYNYVAVEARVTSTILWGNRDVSGTTEAAQIFSNPSNSVEISYSIVEAWTGGMGGQGNRGDDPLFVAADEGDLRVLPESPAIDAGDPQFDPPPGARDLDGHARVLCGRVDIGAYEFGIGDYECDRDVDLDDYANWPDCMTGPDAGPYPEGCAAFDFNFDADVDLLDFAELQGRLPGGG